MIKAIVYTSNTGFTKRYAELLGNQINIPVYQFQEVEEKLNKEDEIIYMGWIMSGGIKNYEKAKNKYNIKVVCGIGMSKPTEKQYNEIIERHSIKEKFFYLQGGYDKKKLKGIYKFMMSIVEKIIRPNIEKKENKTEDDLEMLEMMKHGKDCVKKENLIEVMNWINSNL